MKAEDIQKLMRKTRFKRLTEEGFTTAELRKELQLSECTVNNFMRREFEAGRIKLCGYKTTFRRDGKTHQTPAYKLT